LRDAGELARRNLLFPDPRPASVRRQKDVLTIVDVGVRRPSALASIRLEVERVADGLDPLHAKVAPAWRASVVGWVRQRRFLPTDPAVHRPVDGGLMIVVPRGDEAVACVR